MAGQRRIADRGAAPPGSRPAVRPVPPPADLAAWAEAAGHAAERGHPVSHRLGGTSWTPAHPVPAGQAAAQMLLEPTVPAPRRRKRRRSWYRRPLIVAPLLLVVLLVGVGGVAVARLESTLAEVRSVSRPPEIVSVSDEDGQPEVSVDTAPAQAALSEAGGGAEVESGLFGRFQDGASNLTDMAGAAAAVAGITDSNAGAMTILIMGVDARPGAPIDVGVKSDVLMILNVDPVAGSCRMLSVPRDTRTELPGYGESKINHALLVGGVPYQLLVVERLLGLTLDHYVLVDFAAFQQVVDVVGGVPVTVPEDIIAANGATLFAAGPQTLDGARALTYARYRDGVDGDIGRIDRQWAILRGLGASAETRDLARDVNGLLPAVEDHVRTDLTAEEMTALARDLDGRCTPDTVETAMLEGTRVRLNDPILRQSVYFNVVDGQLVRERVEELLGQPVSAPAPGVGATVAPAEPAKKPGLMPV